MSCKAIVIVGQTASGKTATAIKLAQALHGEIISADSRQVYKGLTIGADKIAQTDMQGVPHHLIDVADPTADIYTVSNFVSDATKAMGDICARGHTPIIAGGTMLYIDALFNRVQFPNIPPNQALRAELERKTAEELYTELLLVDPTRAASIEPANKRRIIRALEIIATLGTVPTTKHVAPPAHVLFIGLYNEEVIQREKIETRNAHMLEHGLLTEVRELHDAGVSWERMKAFGFEYSFPAQYIKGEITKEECLTKMNSGTWRYARKQKKWWRNRDEIHWFKADEFDAILQTAQEFLRK